VISTDGRFVGFDSSDASLYGTPPTGSFMWHAYLRDRVAGTTRLVDDPAVDPVDGVATLSGISDDGRYATWSCEYCVDPAPAEPNQPEEMSFWTDLQTGHTEMVGMINGDEPTDLDTGQRTLTFSGGISADGSVVAFQTRATNLIPDDTNGKFDVYVERMW
jgi:hypothetical protein